MEKKPIGRIIKPSDNENSQSALRSKMLEFCNDNFENIGSWMDELEADKKIKVLIDVCKFVLPTLQAINLEDKKESSNRQYIQMIQAKIEKVSDKKEAI